ncbi:metal binding domain of Ada family protein [Apiospora kogelbergensis]|uniref:Metal binding domain of Ada family protein n=1 Tax=Apiospora kogelbergensis TaxID=1337665 RepID=A0AAW0RA48_9PEZI
MPHTSFASDSARWSAVRRKDAQADGLFVYCVRTTQIYCRPVCKARLARRDNVVFHDGPDAAARAGFRPCKRCKPHLGDRMPETAAVRHLESSSPPVGRLACLERMARQAGVSKWHFHRTFKEVTQMTPTAYLRQRLGSGSLPGFSETLGDSIMRSRSDEGTVSTATSEQGSVSIDSAETDLMAQPLYDEELGQPCVATPTFSDLYFDFESFIADLDSGLYDASPYLPDQE